jgi:1-acyl-sn-glycerol-3-phosphate acyltransferase
LPACRTGRATIGWYGDMDMVPHLVSVLRGGPLDVEVRFGEPLPFDAGSERKAVTRQAEDQVRAMMSEGLTGRRPGICIQ